MKSGPRCRVRPSMHQSLLGRFEDNVDLVLSHRHDDPQAEGWVVDELLDLVSDFRAVPGSCGNVFAGDSLLERNYHPFVAGARLRGRPGAGGCGTERVISAASIAPHPRDLRPDHSEDGVSQLQLAARAECVDLSSDRVRRHRLPLQNWPEVCMR